MLPAHQRTAAKTSLRGYMLKQNNLPQHPGVPCLAAYTRHLHLRDALQCPGSVIAGLESNENQTGALRLLFLGHHHAHGRHLPAAAAAAAAITRTGKQ